MAQFTWEPLLADVGSAPSNGMTIGGQSDGAAVTVVDAGGGVPALNFLGGAGTRRRRVSWTGASGPGSFTDGETYCLFTSVADGGVINGGPAVRLPGDTSSSCASYYLRTEVGTTTTGRVAELNSSSTNTNHLTTGNSPIAATNGDLMHAIIRVQGDQVSGKIWKDGDAEPAFTGPVTDTSLTAGYAGFLVYSVPNTNIFFIGVGTGTDSAPRTAATSGNASASGAVVTTTAALVPGTATGVRNSTATGATLTAVISLNAGSAEGASASTASGQVLGATATLIAGSASGAAAVGGVLQSVAVSVVPGSASAAGDPNNIRLQLGIYREAGAQLGAVSNLKYVVLSDDLTTVIQSGLVTSNSSGVAIIDVNGSPWVAGDYAPVLIAEYADATAPQDRVVNSGLGFVPAVAQP